MKIINRLCGSVMVISAFFIILITSVEIAAYGNFDFYEEEYEKNEVLSAVNMDMEHLMEVTKEMMKYLRGDRETLVIETEIGGARSEFFNDREKLHMADCRVLFVAAIWIRRVCLLLFALSLLVIFVQKTNSLVQRLCFAAGFFWRGMLVLLGAAGALAAVIALNFDKAFVTFHHIFFDNDLWILNPATDRLINIVPQPFFVDICLRIGIIFGILLILFFSMAFITERVIIKKLKRKNNQ